MDKSEWLNLIVRSPLQIAKTLFSGQVHQRRPSFHQVCHPVPCMVVGHEGFGYGLALAGQDSNSKIHVFVSLEFPLLGLF